MTELVNCIKIEMYKTLYNKTFLFSILSLFSLVIIHIFYQIIPYYGIIDGEYPETVFNHWIGLQINGIANIYYMVVIGFATLPVGVSYIEEKKNGYFNQLIIRSGRKKVVVSKLIAYVITAFLIAVLPLLLDYMVAAVLLPSIRPISATFLYAIRGDTDLIDLFYKYPTIYLLLYILIDGIGAVVFALLVIPATRFIKNSFASICFPVLLFYILKVFLNFIKLYEYDPLNIFYPAMSDNTDIKNIVLEIFFVGIAGIIGLLYEVYFYEI